jgi:hypothetical protein
MKTLLLNNGQQIQNQQITLKVRIGREIEKAKKELVDFAKYLYVVTVLVLLVVAVLEIKRMYQIDLFPGIDTPFDNVYFAGKEQFGQGVL